jgi:hypothetical protein
MSDSAKLRAYFEAHPNRSIKLPTLGRVASPYSITKRISDLRKRGMIIRNAVRRVNGKTHSTYRYVA